MQPDSVCRRRRIKLEQQLRAQIAADLYASRCSVLAAVALPDQVVLEPGDQGHPCAIGSPAMPANLRMAPGFRASPEALHAPRASPMFPPAGNLALIFRRTAAVYAALWVRVGVEGLPAQATATLADSLGCLWRHR